MPEILNPAAHLKEQGVTDHGVYRQHSKVRKTYHIQVGITSPGNSYSPGKQNQISFSGITLTLCMHKNLRLPTLCVIFPEERALNPFSSLYINHLRDSNDVLMIPLCAPLWEDVRETQGENNVSYWNSFLESSETLRPWFTTSMESNSTGRSFLILLPCHWSWSNITTEC